MNDSLSVPLVMCMVIAFFVGRSIVERWISTRACRKLINDLKEVKGGHCPRCHKTHPEAVSRVGFHNFWTRFHCPSCKYGVELHLDAHQDDDL